jgi:hypothetical protein
MPVISPVVATGTYTIASDSTISGTLYGVTFGADGNASNLGTVFASDGVGININGVGFVSNDITGLITGSTMGIYTDGAGTVINLGSIIGGQDGLSVNGVGIISNYTGAVINGTSFGIYTTGAGTVENLGGIAASSGAGIQAGGVGIISNSAAGSISGTSFGINIGGAGTVTNAGSILASAGVGLELVGLATVDNTGLISGTHAGVVTDGVNASLVNTGSIVSAAGDGVDLVAGGTLVDAGLISGGNGTAIYFGGGATNLLVLDQGASLTGAAIGAGGATNIVELGAGSTGTLTNFGSEFVNFDTLTVDSGAHWVIDGGAPVGITVAAGGSVIYDGVLYGTLPTRPAITGLPATASGTDNASLAPFGATTITDPDTGAATSASITLTNSGAIPTDANGLLSGTGLTKSGVGIYTLSATSPAGLTTELQALSFAPTPGLNVTTSFGLTVADGGTSSTAGLIVTETACFVGGTHLRAQTGDILVEDITPGTLLQTASGALLPVRWLGRSVVSTGFADPQRVLPIRIKAGALGETLPTRDLLVSPDHAMFLGGVLIQAGALVNGVSIVRETNMAEFFTYYHVELASHALLLAENAATESFIDHAGRMNFTNWAEHDALAGTAPITEMPHPRAKAQRQLPMSVRRMLHARMLACPVAKAAA